MFELNKIPSRTVHLLLLFLSAIFSCLIVVPKHFPYLGIGVSFIILSALVFAFKKERTSYTRALYFLTLLFSFFIFYRVNSFLVLLNLTAVIYFGSTLVLSDKELTSFFDLLLSPFIVFFRALRIKSTYKLDLTSYIEQERFNTKKFYNVVLSIFLTIFILLIIVPLLSYSNLFFSRLVTNFLNTLNLRRLVEILFKENFLIYAVRSLLFLVLALFIPRLMTYVNTRLKESSAIQIPLPINDLLIPKIVVGIVLVVFFITQAQLYFATEDILKVLGYSHSQYAREVFAHLSIVTLIIFGLIYTDRGKSSFSKVATYLLIIEGIFLNFMALKSVYDYSSNWGFTHKRLYGFVIVIWILGVFSLFSYKYLKNLKNASFVRNMLFWSGFILLAINVLNFDYIIYHYAKSTTHEGIDYYYLARLSPDAKSYYEHIQKVASEIENSDEVDSRKIFAASLLINKIEKLKNKYKDLNVRTFNFSEFFEYQSVQNLNLETYKLVLNSKQVLLGLPPFGPETQIRHEPPKTNIQRVVGVTLDNLDKRLYNHNFEIKDENNRVLVRGSLDNDSFNHTFGLGKFSITIYEYITEKDNLKEIPAKELFYKIYPDELTKIISVK